jgi:hypothetical protein
MDGYCQFGIVSASPAYMGIAVHGIARPTTTMFRAAALLSFRSTSLTRTYVTVGGRSYPRPVATPSTAQASTVQTDASKGTPDTVNDHLSDGQNEINNNTAESIPSSATPGLPPLLDAPPPGGTTDWSRSYHGLSTQPFPPEVTDVLQADIDSLDIEMKPGTSLLALLSLSLLLRTASLSRRHDLSPRNQVPQNLKQGVWSWWLGSCSS